MEKLTVYTNAFNVWLSNFGPKLLGAILVFVIGLYLINWIGRLFNRSFTDSKIDVSLHSLLSSLLMAGLRVLLLITVAGMLGIQTTSFVAIIGALGLAVGLALQGSLSNFAGGVLIMVFKPFKVGDIIESQAQNGVVIEIQIFNTMLLTPDNRTVILPNGSVSNNSVINYSRHGNIRVDIHLEIEIENDMDTVRRIATEACLKHADVLKTPAPIINIGKINEDKISLGVLPYTTAQNYWSVYHGVQELIVKAFAEHKVALPKPHMFITQIPAEA